MTPPDLPLDDGPLDDDALAVHAVVDDEATAEQRRRVARDPELVARVAALRATVAAVAAPVEPPPADVLAALRRRALDALDTLDTPAEADPAPPEPATRPSPPPPVGDLAATRARRTRTLPPLPAVAAVVVLLVVVGVGLLLAGTAGKGEDSADRSSSGAGGEQVQTQDGGDDAAADAPTAADGDESFSAEAEDRPADQLRDDLLAQATVSYADQADLEADLRRVDVDTFDLAGSFPETTQGDGGGSGDATTTAPSTAGADSPSPSPSPFAYASDPDVTRCDAVVRASEPELEAAVAAVLVEVDGEPVLVLSNPTEVSDRAPDGIRLTILNAVDCSPRGGVLR